MDRICAICGSKNNKKVYKQEFASVKQVTFVKKYDVVICKKCGFIFATDIPNQSDFESYYKEMSKYENDIIYYDYKKSKQIIEQYYNRFKKIKNYVTFDSDILEIGCANGEFLDYLKCKGFKNISGIDPSRKCVKFMKDNYNVNSKAQVISEIDTINKYDLILMVGVWEHIVDIDQTIEKIKKILKIGGILYIEVPDFKNFSSETDMPFQEFSIEHVNFFSKESLRNLFGKYKFELISINVEEKCFEDLTAKCIFALFKQQDKVNNIIIKDSEALEYLEKYINDSMEKHNIANEKIKKYIDKPLVVWGMGTHTLRMLVKSDLKNCDIKAFVDRNIKYQGVSWNGIKIVLPEDVKNFKDAVILVSTLRYKTEIENYIRNDLRIDNEIIYLY